MRKTNSPRGPIYHYKNLSVFIRSSGHQEAKLVGLSDDLMALITRNAEKFSEEYQCSENKKAVDTVHSRLRLLYRDLRDAHRNHNARVANTAAPAALTDAAWESEMRTHIRMLPLPERARAVAGLSFAQSSALVRYGDLERLGLPEAVTTAVRARHRTAGAIERLGLSAGHARRSALDEPLPSGMDETAAFAEAEAKLAELDSESEALGYDAAGLAGIVKIVAEASGQDAASLWAEIAS